MRFQTLPRLVAEDFPKDQQSLINKLASIYNPMIDQFNIIFNKQIDFQNLNQQLITLTTTVDGSGAPNDLLQVVSTLKTQVKGIVSINAINVTDNTTLTGGISFLFTNTSDKLITITQITGLPADKKFNLVVILYG